MQTKTIKIVWFSNPIDATPFAQAQEHNVVATQYGVEEYDDYGMCNLYEIIGKSGDVDAFVECCEGLDLSETV